ncbi:uncharacterized protein LOC129750766 [Uranotaenia lowii]|uniref:uncharacterized protein LOC129750766 n=1 Tax=Uranotaenia lowii TaxID=190385 RepID=UPI00247979ED|nr:uncharacterized protein LOC129750766 [Uranotaenia lowii]XP_055601769.1 uncharacterized protein LOC129750766 [Uranotaenia lowii]
MQLLNLSEDSKQYLNMENLSKFEELEREIRRIDIDADTIQVTYHQKKFAELFQRHIADERILSDLFSYLNQTALADGKFAINVAAIFASRQLDELVIAETKLRNAMLTILQQNFQNIEKIKREGIEKFYNSVILLGEYYNRKKFPNGTRIKILGQSLLLLLTTELESEIKHCQENEGHRIDPEFAKLILSQITLNGGEAKVEHKQEIEDLNYSIRKCLINVDRMAARAKAYLLMALDLFYANFNLNSNLLEKLYGKFLFEPDENSSGKQAEVQKDVIVKKTESVQDKPLTNGSKTATNKGSDKVDPARKQRQTKPVPNKPAKPEPRSNESNTKQVKSPNVPKKTSPQAVAPRRPPLNTGKRESKPKPATPSIQKQPPATKRTPTEKIRPQTPDHTTSRTQQSFNSNSQNTNGSPKSSNKTPADNPSVLKQNCKPSPKHLTTSPISAPRSPTISPLKVQIPPVGVGVSALMTSPSHHHHNNSADVENLAWDDLTLDDESPQKINPHTKSFLNFLAQK